MDAVHDLAHIVNVFEDNSLPLGDTKYSQNDTEKLWDRIKNTSFSPSSINKLIEALANGSTCGNSEAELEDAVGVIVQTTHNKGQSLEPVIEYVIAYSNNSIEERSTQDLEVAVTDTINKSGYSWKEVGNTIELLTKYSESSSKKISVLQLNDVICKTLEYMKVNNLDFDTIRKRIDNIQKTEFNEYENIYNRKIEKITKHHTGLIKKLMLLKEEIIYEMHKNYPVFGVQEICDRIINDKDNKYIENTNKS